MCSIFSVILVPSFTLIIISATVLLTVFHNSKQLGMLTLNVEHNYICFHYKEFTTTTCFGPICGQSPDDGPHIGPKHVVVVNSL